MAQYDFLLLTMVFFMCLYKYVNAKTLDFILNGSIRFTQPGGFNDPFELSLEVFNPYKNDDKSINLKFCVLKNSGEIIKHLLPSDFEDENCNDLFSRLLVKRLSEEIGILCLTKNPKSHLMWAHYADEYSGAVVEFDESHEFFTGIFEVPYKRERPIVHMDYFINTSPIPLSDLCVKPDVWGYENEWRVIRSLVDCKNTGKKIKKHNVFTHDIPQDAIKGIILGERCSLHDARNIFNKVKNTKITLAMAALANWKYDFRFEPIKLNEPISKMMPIISPYTAEIFVNEAGTIGEAARWMVEHHPMKNVAKWRL